MASAFPLYEAARGGRVAAVRALLDAGADVNESMTEGGAKGKTALHAAMYPPRAEVVRLLLERGADPNALAIGMTGTPLHMAAKEGYLDMVQLLLEHGADKTIEAAGGRTAASVAERNFHLEVAQALGRDTSRVPRKIEDFPEAGTAETAEKKVQAHLAAYVSLGLMALVPVAVLLSSALTWLRTGRLRLASGRLPGRGLAALCAVAGALAGGAGLVLGAGPLAVAALAGNVLLAALVIVVLRKL